MNSGVPISLARSITSTPPTTNRPSKYTAAVSGSRCLGSGVTASTSTVSTFGDQLRHAIEQLERVERLGDVLVRHRPAGLHVGRLGLGRQQHDRDGGSGGVAL